MSDNRMEKIILTIIFMVFLYFGGIFVHEGFHIVQAELDERVYVRDVTIYGLSERSAATVMVGYNNITREEHNDYTSESSNREMNAYSIQMLFTVIACLVFGNKFWRFKKKGGQ